MWLAVWGASGMMMAAVSDYTMLFPTAAVVGFAYGGMWGVVPTLPLPRPPPPRSILGAPSIYTGHPSGTYLLD
eukprot:COSAG05_NODE_690_length_7901_cov_174.242886_9_plen_73_part_00